MPSSKRPPERTSTVAASLASASGWRVIRGITEVPSRTRSVTAARSRRRDRIGERRVVRERRRSAARSVSAAEVGRQGDVDAGDPGGRKAEFLGRPGQGEEAGPVSAEAMGDGDAELGRRPVERGAAGAETEDHPVGEEGVGARVARSGRVGAGSTRMVEEITLRAPGWIPC
jgi:hypothetical protein